MGQCAGRCGAIAQPSVESWQLLSNCLDARQLPRYYAAVRLLSAMAHRGAPKGFPMRSSLNVEEDSGISRIPRKVLVCAHRVSDREGSNIASPKRLSRCDLRLIPTASAPQSPHVFRRRTCISRLNSWPALPPVNASPTPSRMCTHDSESS